MLEISDLSYKYRGNPRLILDGVSFSVKEGEVVALVGQNGSGKSTIGRLIAGILKLQSGTISIDNHKIDKKSNKVSNQVGIVFQNPENQIIFDRVEDELGFALQDLPPAEVKSRISAALKEVGMSDCPEAGLYSFSLGQKQRIVIAEALARRPKYLVLDEPTTMIDSEGKEAIYDLIRRLRKSGHTIICITNLADEILLADRTLVLEDGKIVAEIKRPELIKKAHLLQKHHIHLPTLLQILAGLRRQGITLELDDFTVAELTHKIKAELHGRR